MKVNENIRKEMKEKGVRQWEVAAALGVSEQSLIRWLRFPLTEEKERAILGAIAKLEREVS